MNISSACLNCLDMVGYFYNKLNKDGKKKKEGEKIAKLYIIMIL